MHISEGILTPSLLIGGAALSAVGVAIGLRQLDFRKIPQTALLSSAFFVASLIHVPVGPGSVHLVLNGLLGMILGWLAFPSILVALFLQAVLFQFGGITTLGVNTFCMAMPAVLAYYMFSRLVKGSNRKLAMIGAALGGFTAICLSTFLVALFLTLTGEGFTEVAKLIFISHVPVMVVESVVTMFIVNFLRKTKPEILGMEQL